MNQGPAKEQQRQIDVVYVIFTAEIRAQTTESLIAVLANCVTQKVKTVHLLMSTPGGDVGHGIALYNVMKGMPFKLITHNTGNVDSIGNAIFLAGEERYACPHSVFMFHGVGQVVSNRRLEEKDARELLDGIAADHKRIGSILKERTEIDEAAAQELFREAQTKDVAFAVSAGIVHEIRDVNIPHGSTVVSLVFQR